MKQKIASLLTICVLVLAANASSQTECDLAAEIFPLEYVFVTRSVNFRLRFTSTCLSLRDFTFEGFFSFRNRLSKQDHPIMIDLEIFKNKYRLFYGAQEEKNKKTILRKYVYNEASINPSERKSGMIATNKDNRVILDQKVSNSYNQENLKKMLYMNNPITCAIKKGNNKLMKCIVK